MKETVAVIMSLYKNDKLEYVKLAVESILNQSYHNFDFFVQYDGPIKEDVDSYLMEQNDKRMKIYKRTKTK